MQPPLSLRLLDKVALPHFGFDPGTIHTMLKDAEGTYYYSDEINHTLVSLSAAGQVRWYRSGRGIDAGQFQYPKGIDLGWIDQNGTRTRCIAACDAWNRRVQFFGLDGSFLTSWNAVGASPFGEPVDIRFIGGKNGSCQAGSCWLVLDRQLHCLFGLDWRGVQTFRFGRALPENMESGLALPSDHPESNASSLDPLREYLPYDPLFMPLRIFGNSHEAVFLWIPRSRSLRHSVAGNLLPVWIGLPAGSQWIGADAHGLLCFDRASGVLLSYDVKEKTWQSVPVKGLPIPSGRSSQEVWTQDGSLVCHWGCGAESAEYCDSPPWMVSGLPDEIGRILAEGVVSSDIRELQEAAFRLFEISNQVLSASSDQWADDAFINKAKAELAAFRQGFATGFSKPRELERFIFLASIKLQALHNSWGSSHPLIFRQALDRILAATRSMAGLFEKVVLVRDDWFFTRLATQAFEDEDSTGIRQVMLQEHDDALLNAARKLAGWLWYVPFSDRLFRGPEVSTALSSVENRKKNVECLSPILGYSWSQLREVDRIYVGGGASVDCASPATICCHPETGYLVSLKNSGQILHLSEKGEVLNTIDLPPAAGGILRKPHGIATDRLNRLWISDPQDSFVGIISTTANQLLSLEELAGRPLNLKYPTGIHQASNGQMLIADTQNSRILMAAMDGQITALVDRQGKHAGELRHPVAFCGAKGKPAFWVADIRNHRLQRFHLDGQFEEMIGGIGLGKGRLVLPESVSMFEDGTLAVSQRQCTRAVKLFSEIGDEFDTLQLDYGPWGILAHRGFLLVCEGDGNHIRVYERR